MRRVLAVFALLLLALPAWAQATTLNIGDANVATNRSALPVVALLSSQTPPTLAFTPLHTYYVSPTGRDSNSGTAPSFAWATPNHSVVCGDVIIAAAGNYTYTHSYNPFGALHWGTVSNCPSTSGGIDGTGGVYFAVLLCAGPNVESCQVTGTASTYEDFRIDASDWAVEGFWATNSGGATNGRAVCFTGTSESATTLHHIAFINDICSTGAQGFSTYSWHSPFAPGGVDYTAVVGDIAYNAATAGAATGLCNSNISIIPSNYDLASGTHIFVAGAFSYKALDGNNCIGNGTTDGEGLIFDSWAAAPYTNQAVVEQSVFWLNGSNAFQAFPQNHSTKANDGLTTNCPSGCDSAKIYFFNNTTYGNTQDANHGGSGIDTPGAELWLHGVYPQLSAISGGLYSVTNNIFVATKNGSKANYGIEVDCSATTNESCGNYVTTSGNYVYNISSPTSGTGPNNTVYLYSTTYGGAATYKGTSWPFGTNTYSNPNLANPSALPTGAPSCSAYANVFACMQAAGVIADIGTSVAAGYAPPGACAPDPYFPTWLKGIVYLSVSGSTITENSGLITKPCNM